MNNHITFNKTSKRYLGLKTKTIASIVIIILITFIGLSVLWTAQASFGQTIDVGNSNFKPDLTRSETKGVPQEAEIEAYVHTIFGRDGNMAVAIHKAECNPLNRTYPKCGPYITPREHSVGIFQINLLAHGDKVPGNTLEEKQKYLENPFNNTLVAYKIFKGSSWTAWSGFTGGKYLTYLK